MNDLKLHDLGMNFSCSLGDLMKFGNFHLSRALLGTGCCIHSKKLEHKVELD